MSQDHDSQSTGDQASGSEANAGATVAAAGEAEKAKLQSTIAKLENQLEDEVLTVRNFSMIGVLVFIAGLLFLLLFDTSALPIKHAVLPKPTAKGQAVKAYNKGLAEKELSTGRGLKLNMETTLSDIQNAVFLKNLGVSVKAGAGAVTVSAVEDKHEGGLSLAPGQNITAINGIDVSTVAEFLALGQTVVPGQEIALTVNGQEQKAKFHEHMNYLHLEEAVKNAEHAMEGVVEAHWEKHHEVNLKGRLAVHKVEKTLKKAQAKKDKQLIEIAQGKVKAEKEKWEAKKKALTEAFERELELVLADLHHAAHGDKDVNKILFGHEDHPKEGKFYTDKSFVGTYVRTYGGFLEWKTNEQAKMTFQEKHEFDKTQANSMDPVHATLYRMLEPRLVNDFGSPAEPRLAGMKEDMGLLKHGERFYFRHCQHCHGMSGYGDGPTAPFLNPRPRNYTRGIFKLRSNKTATKPSMKDLVRVLKHGMPGSMMPPFRLYKEADIKAVAHYVRYLAIRGEVEYRINKEVFEADVFEYDPELRTYGDNNVLEWEDPETEEDVTGDVFGRFEALYKATLKTVVADWKAAESADNQIVPSEEPPSYADKEAWAAAVEEGRQLFITKECKSCHGFYGKGGGEKSEGMMDDWGFPIKPRNLTRGVYRGGARPIDLFWRISAGIAGSGMPPHHSNVTEEERWKIVCYVKSLADKSKR